MRAVVTRNAGTPEGVANIINGMLGKELESPRDDFPGRYEISDIVSLQVIQLSYDSWYGVAVIEMEKRKEAFDVERAFFADNDE